jgi:hypothetical protein
MSCFVCRRGLEFKHIDPNLFTFCKKVAEEMRVSAQTEEDAFTPRSTVIKRHPCLTHCLLQDFYKDRIGVIYVLHVNIFFWLLYTVGNNCAQYFMPRSL